MSKKLILTLSDDLAKYVTESAKNLGVTRLDYIRHVLMKDKESRE
jgi:hypothetical protein